MSINGDKYSCSVFKNSDCMIMEEGRCPQYDNEIAVTDFLAKELNLKIGDKVTVSRKDLKSEYIITGINIFANDLGLTFAMPLEGAKKLDIKDTFSYGFNLVDTTKCSDISDKINEKYSDILTVATNEVALFLICMLLQEMQ